MGKVKLFVGRCILRGIILLWSLVEVAALAIIICILVEATAEHDPIAARNILMLFTIPVLALPILFIAVMAFFRAAISITQYKSWYGYAVMATLSVITIWTVGLICLLPEGKECSVTEMTDNYEKHHQDMSAITDYVQTHWRTNSSIRIERSRTGEISIATHCDGIHGYYKYDKPDSTQIDLVMQVCGLTRHDYSQIRKLMQAANVIGVEIDKREKRVKDLNCLTCDVIFLYRYAGFNPYRYYFINKDEESDDQGTVSVRLNDSVVAVAGSSWYCGAHFGPDE